MKVLYRSIVVLLVLLVIVVSSCTKNMTTLNVNPKVDTIVQGETLFSNGELALANNLVTPNVNVGIFELIAQYWAETTYPQESQYDLGNRDIALNFWNAMYRDVIMDFDRSIQLMRVQAASPTLLESEKAAYTNKIAIAKIMRAYSFSILVNTFGDIPYTQALQGRENTTPAYDKQKDVYYALLDTISTSISELDLTSGGFGNADLIYGGDVEKWYKFANSIQLKLGMIIADVDPETAKAKVLTAVQNGVFTSNADNALLNYTTTPPNVNPIWTNLVQSGRNDFVAANTIVDTMSAHNDPRLPFYFSEGPNGGYIGGIYGSGNRFANFSHPSDQVEAADFPAIIMDYAEVEFLLAEAAARGMGVTGSAVQHYNNAVTASITFWGGTTEQAASYLANPKNQFDASNWKKSIGVQQWIAYYTRGFDAWISFRRLDYPQLKAPPSAVTPFPMRYTYPSTEPNLNSANYTAAASSIGGDAVTTKLFWDVH